MRLNSSALNVAALNAGGVQSSSAAISAASSQVQGAACALVATVSCSCVSSQAQGVPVVAGDTNYSNVSLLLHGDGTNGAQNNTFIDSSTNNFTVTCNGTPTQGSFSPFPLTAAYSPSVNGGSGWFNNPSFPSSGGDYLSIPTAGNEYNFGVGDFTVEGWLYANTLASSYNSIFDLGPGLVTFTLYINSGKLDFWIAGGSVGMGATTVTTGAWHHFAISRSGTSLKVFLDGVQDSVATNSTNVSSHTVARIGQDMYDSGNGAFNGGISNLRIVKGTAVYTSNFTPSTTPLTAITNTSLLLNFTNAGIYDNAAKNDLVTVGNAQISTSVKKYGTGSIAFDGSGDYLSNTTAAVTNFGTGAFTVEYWVYPTATNGTYQQHVGSAQTSTGFACGMLSSGGTVYGTTISTGFDTSVAFTLNTWQHIAWVRSGTTLTAYKNGTSVGTFTVSTNFNEVGVGIGAQPNGAFITTACYIDDLRITKGVARYTANFTPPTEAFPGAASAGATFDRAVASSTASSQSQSTAVVFPAFGSSIASASSQSQSSSAAATRSASSSAASSQAQSTVAVNERQASCSVSTGQAQSQSGNAGKSVSLVSASSQAQGAALTVLLGYPTQSSQSQSSAVDTARSVSCFAASGQAQGGTASTGLSVVSSSATSQAQSDASSTQRSTSLAVVSSTSQSTLGSIAQVNQCSTASGQCQSASVALGRSVSASSVTAQAQASASAYIRSLNAFATAYQAQSVAGQTQRNFAGGATHTSQSQSAILASWMGSSHISDFFALVPAAIRSATVLVTLNSVIVPPEEYKSSLQEQQFEVTV